MKKLILISLFFISICVTTVEAGIYGTIDLGDYQCCYHDSVGNTLAITIDWSDDTGNSTISNCTLAVFTKKGVKKFSLNFDKAIGSDKIDILYFEKTWAIVRVEGNDSKVFSLKLSKKAATVLGEILEDANFGFRFVSGKNIVSFVNSEKTCQLYDQKLEKIGASVVLIGRPYKLNGGKYFYCEDNDKTQIFKVKKGFEKVIDQAGEFEEINEQKRLCCIRNGDFHKICKY